MLAAGLGVMAAVLLSLQTFLVRKCSSSQRKLLCLRATADKSASSVQECFICEEDSSEYDRCRRRSCCVQVHKHVRRTDAVAPRAAPPFNAPLAAFAAVSQTLSVV